MAIHLLTKTNVKTIIDCCIVSIDRSIIQSLAKTLLLKAWRELVKGRMELKVFEFIPEAR